MEGRTPGKRRRARRSRHPCPRMRARATKTVAPAGALTLLPPALVLSVGRESSRSFRGFEPTPTPLVVKPRPRWGAA
eukprot:2343936-Prymnesium_polylepis.1